MISIRPVGAGDFGAWNALWQEYLAFYGESLSEEVTRGVWQRFLDRNQPLEAWLAWDDGGQAVGFANTVLHPHTWSLQTLCYLEDLYVAEPARGQNVGHALIEFLKSQGRSRGWRRVYWHTESANERARRLYDRFAPADAYVRYTQTLESENLASERSSWS